MHSLPEETIVTILLLWRTERVTSFCPSEVARAVDPGAWRRLMPLVRELAAHLVEEGLLLCTQRGKRAHPLLTPGALRLQRAPHTR